MRLIASAPFFFSSSRFRLPDPKPSFTVYIGFGKYQADSLGAFLQCLDSVAHSLGMTGREGILVRHLTPYLIARAVQPNDKAVTSVGKQ